MRPIEVVANPRALDAVVDRRIDPGDQMYTGDDERYLAVGLDAITKIASFQVIAGAGEPARVLDFACGHGRVGRYLRAAYPEADLVGADVMARALPFYEQTCAARAVLSVPELHDVELGERFDLIWSGSLLTHLAEGPAEELIALFDRHLADRGLVVFSVHGRFVASRWRSGKWPYRMTEEHLRALSDRFDAGQYSYADYDHMKGYGISMTPLVWVMRQLDGYPQLRMVGMTERGWDDHQDLVALQRIPAV